MKDLHKRVDENLELPIVEPFGGPLQEVQKLLLSLWCLVSQLMGMKLATREECNATEQLVRICLSHVYDHDCSMNPQLTNQNGNPTWLSAYNFVCLLNLPQQIKMMGPIQNRWEGGLRGKDFHKLKNH